MQLARLKGTLVHLLTYDHDNGDDENDDGDDKNDQDHNDNDDEDDMKVLSVGVRRRLVPVLLT